MSRPLIIGSQGQLGRALSVLYPDAIMVDRAELDITDQSSVENFDWSEVSIILNAAAYTAVDQAETAEGRIAAWGVNASAVHYIALAATTHNLTLVHVSSDYVFDGTHTPHSESEPFSPLSVYGASKAAGDIAAASTSQHYIVRTSWVIGEGKNFIATMHDLATRDISPSVVDDQRGRLTFTTDLAAGIKHLLDSHAPYGTYNLTNSGDVVSWADIARLVYEHSGKTASQVTGVSTEEYYRDKEGIAPRPLGSELSLEKIAAAGYRPRDWREAFDEYLAGGIKEN